MLHNKFAKNCETYLTELFEKAKQTDEEQFFTSCFVLFKYDKYNMLSYVLDEEFQEVTEFISSFGVLLESEDIDIKIKTRVRVLLYCHIIEVDLIYTLIFNLLKTIARENYSANILHVSKKNEIINLHYPAEKIDLISRYSKKYGLELHKLYHNIFYKQIRNAFSHSQYSLSPDGGFNISKFISPSSQNLFKQPKFKTFFTFDEISSLFDKSFIYIKSFIETYNRYISKYQDGNIYSTQLGDIVYNTEHGWMFNRQLE